jgi:ABC-type polysaccharide/polyol phosphate export permease
VLGSLQQLFRYRALIQSLVARELRARYRGSVLGFLWSFINPLLLLLVFTFVFTVVLPGARGGAMFMFCGILPWTWFSASLLESSTVLIGGGNLIRKVLFPAEILPIVTVLAGLVHFSFGLPILAAFFLYTRVPVEFADLVWLPVVVATQLMLTLGLALFVSAVGVHFRDLRDLLSNALTLWFFSTPIVYPLAEVPESLHWFLRLNPFTHLAVAYQEVLLTGPFTSWRNLAALTLFSTAVLAGGYAVFDRLRDTLAEEL